MSKITENTRILRLKDNTFLLINSYDECPLSIQDEYGNEDCNLGCENCPNKYHALSLDCPLEKLSEVMEEWQEQLKP